jgi:spermidine synthase
MGNWHTDLHSPHRGLTFEVESVLYQESSQYQTIQILQTPEFGRVMLLDGVLMLTEKDEFVYHEMLAHPALFTHPEPNSVLIIGGGDCGTQSRVLQHRSVKSVLQVELDEMVTRVSKEYFHQLTSAAEDPRVELVFADGIQYLQDTKAKFDVILIDSTDPQGPAEGLFRKPFFSDCHKALKDDGILCLQSESPWIESLRGVISEVNHDLKQLFPIVHAYSAAIQTYQAGLWLFQMASKRYSPLETSIGANISASGIPARYYHAGLHYAAFVLPVFVRELLY